MDTQDLIVIPIVLLILTFVVRNLIYNAKEDKMIADQIGEAANGLEIIDFTEPRLPKR